ncbi:hypothetical protein [Beduini sp.]|uniref:hypothetical protein n=1 Tax=Beduini sp. TaxID=1922300 RepID=UPI00399082D6
MVGSFHFSGLSKAIQHRRMNDFNGVEKRIEIDVMNLDNLNYQEIIAKIKAQLQQQENADRNGLRFNNI